MTLTQSESRIVNERRNRRQRSKGMNGLSIPPEASGLQLCKMFGDELRICEAIRFVRGAPAVDMILRRAAIGGKVEVGEGVELQTYWADILDSGGSIISHAALDAGSFRSLKNHWMRCKYETDPPKGDHRG